MNYQHKELGAQAISDIYCTKQRKLHKIKMDYQSINEYRKYGIKVAVRKVSKGDELKVVNGITFIKKRKAVKPKKMKLKATATQVTTKQLRKLAKPPKVLGQRAELNANVLAADARDNKIIAQEELVLWNGCWIKADKVTAIKKANINTNSDITADQKIAMRKAAIKKAYNEKVAK